MSELILLTVSEVAMILRINILTVYDYIRKQKLPAIRLGRSYRIDKQALSDFIEKHTTFLS
jgi:excisionase family DNA binding protein